MAFKPRGVPDSDAIAPEKLRALLRQAKLQSKNTPEDSALFQFLDNLGIVTGDSKDGLEALAKVVNNLITVVNNLPADVELPVGTVYSTYIPVNAGTLLGYGVWNLMATGVKGPGADITYTVY